jgi:flagellar hook assembly protein FlgD
MMFKMILLLLITLSGGTGLAATFVQPPMLTEAGGNAVVSFSVSASTDVEVAILDNSGKVVRHLAAGVLGGDTLPPEPLAGGLAQSLTWDGLDDYGNALFSPPFKVRVRLGVTPQFEKRIHLKDAAMIPPSNFPNWNPAVTNLGWGADTVADTSEIISVTDPMLHTGMLGTSRNTGLGLNDGGITMIDLCVSKETDDIIFQEGASFTGGSPTLLSLNGITSLKRRLWTGSTGGFAFGEPVMDWFGRFFFHDRGYSPCSPDLYRFSMDGTAINYSWGTNWIDVPTFSNDGIRQEGFCNDQHGNIYQAHYPFDSAVIEPIYVSKWDSVGARLSDSLITVATAVQGIRTDLKGNIFLGVKMKPVSDTVPNAVRNLLSGAFNERSPFSQAAVADEVYASIVKFGPQGGSIVKDAAGPYYKISYYRGAPVNPAGNRLSVQGTQWVHFGNSFIFSKTPDNDMTVCCCYNPRFDVDRFGRVIYPDPFGNQFRALDNNGNMIFRVHNRDLFPSVKVGAIVDVQATDRALYLGDHINNQIIVMTWKADAETLLSISSAMAQNLRPILGPLTIANIPNPFTASTSFRIRGAVSFVLGSLAIYNMAGRKIADLTPGLKTGTASVEWKGMDSFGKKAPSGLYCCRLSLNGKIINKTIMLTR